MSKLKSTRWITLERCDKFISDVYFSDINLKGKLFPKDLQKPVDLQVFSVPDLKRITFDEAIKGDFKPSKVGDSFSPSWSTHWFKISIEIPTEWKNLCVQLQWDSDSEALLYDTEGKTLQAFTGGNGCDRRAEYTLDASKDKQNFYLEMACNGMFGVGNEGMINAPDPNRSFSLKTAQIVVLDEKAFDVYMDFLVIYEMAKELPEDSTRGNQAMFTCNEMINQIDTSDPESWKNAKKLSSDFFNEKNGDSQHKIIAVGHCHIDVAWLWPYDETKRKTARSFATQLNYMDQYPFYKFVQSNAQLYEWMKDLYPELYSRMKEKVKSGQLLPVGGTWVEMCGNLPGGESVVRQFLLGQKFFKKEFGTYCTEFWLPDSFGYNGQLPQIMKKSGIDSFLTQKLSWNLINKFPHSSFIWKGIDGSEVYTHFPPSDTYNDNVKIDNIVKGIKNFKDKETCKHSLMLYGHGDGGGGPTIEMIERLKRVKNIDGIPKVEPGTPKEFFDTMKKDHKEKQLCTWNGELYLEGHRGIYTSQGFAKRGNRKSEFLLREIEILATIFNLEKYPTKELTKLWKLLLLNQFHDVLPGSSIGLVYEDTKKHYEQIEQKGNELKNEILKGFQSQNESLIVFNSLNWERNEVVELPKNFQSIQNSYSGIPLGLVLGNSIGYVNNKDWNKKLNLTIKEESNSIKMENDFLIVCIDKQLGNLNIYDKRIEEEVVSKGNQFVIHNDNPLFWDAWDIEIYHLQQRKLLNSIGSIKIIENGPLRISVEIITKISKTSTIKQMISMTGINSRIDFTTNIQWNENRKLLKVEFPTIVSSTFGTYEIQYGHLKRPTHYNTSWDVAQFEVCAQKFVDLSEFGYGISLLNNGKHGHNIHDGVITMSLLKAPKAPDENCDIGNHEFKYSLFPHLDSFQDSGVIQEAYNLNSPLTLFSGKGKEDSKSFILVDKKNVIIEAIKKSEDSDDVIVRLYEAFGGHVKVKVKLNVDCVLAVFNCNMLEEELNEIKAQEKEIEIQFKPFEIITLKLKK
eukprot:gene6740-10905_t